MIIFHIIWLIWLYQLYGKRHQLSDVGQTSDRTRYRTHNPAIGQH